MHSLSQDFLSGVNDMEVEGAINLERFDRMLPRARQLTNAMQEVKKETERLKADGAFLPFLDHDFEVLSQSILSHEKLLQCMKTMEANLGDKVSKTMLAVAAFSRDSPAAKWKEHLTAESSLKDVFQAAQEKFGQLDAVSLKEALDASKKAQWVRILAVLVLALVVDCCWCT